MCCFDVVVLVVWYVLCGWCRMINGCLVVLICGVGWVDVVV